MSECFFCNAPVSRFRDDSSDEKERGVQALLSSKELGKSVLITCCAWCRWHFGRMGYEEAFCSDLFHSRCTWLQQEYKDVAAPKTLEEFNKEYPKADRIARSTSETPPKKRVRKEITDKGASAEWCVFCGIELFDTIIPAEWAGSRTKDHFVPRRFGGSSVVPCCCECNTMKGASWPDDFLDSRWLKYRIARVSQHDNSGPCLKMQDFKEQYPMAYSQFRALILEKFGE